MNGLMFWWVGAVIGAIGLIGLFVASNAESDNAYWAGLVVFAVAVLVEFWLIKRWFDRIEAQESMSERHS